MAPRNIQITVTWQSKAFFWSQIFKKTAFFATKNIGAWLEYQANPKEKGVTWPKQL